MGRGWGCPRPTPAPYFIDSLVLTTLNIYPYKIFNELDLLEIIENYFVKLDQDYSRDNILINYNKEGYLTDNDLYLNIEEIKNPLIVLPNNFYNNKNIDLFKYYFQLGNYNFPYQFQFESNKNVEKPEAIIMLKSMINGNLFFTENELELRIRHFNKSIANHIRNL